MTTMRALVLVEPQHLEMREVPVPTLNPGEILVQVEACAPLVRCITLLLHRGQRGPVMLTWSPVPGWRNGRRTGLKIPGGNPSCGFESRPRHQLGGVGADPPEQGGHPRGLVRSVVLWSAILWCNLNRAGPKPANWCGRRHREAGGRRRGGRRL